MVAFFILFLVSCESEKSEQQIIAEYVQHQFTDIDQFRLNGRSLSLEEAESVLYCWAYDGGFNTVSQEELEEAIAIVLDCKEDIYDLIFSIDDIDCDEYR